MTPSAVTPAVQRLYNRDPDYEWQRLDRHRLEFAVTLRALAEHLPPPPACILDCGSGPGRYAIELARQGYEVTLFDLSSGNLALAREKAAKAGVTLAACEQGTATDLSRFPTESFDAVLLMGPLYHLLEEAERRQALREAYRVLRWGGPLFAAFVTRYAAHRWAAAAAPNLIVEDRQRLQEVLESGRQLPDSASVVKFVAYFAHPSEVEPLLWGAGFEVERVLAVEGILSRIEEEVNALSGEVWQAWVDFTYRMATDPTLHSAADHLLAVARKPRWRAVLRRIAQALDQAGVAYKVVGGASPALHGVPIPVKDLDIQTDAEGAYRFQALFAEQVVEPVALSDNGAYRSHYGRFSFDGVDVEVMGDQERWQADRWVPTTANTEALVDLDGVSVRVSWLEEEVLAYIRRGRLERAALCLPHCDRDRLLSLLRGKIPTAVL